MSNLKVQIIAYTPNPEKVVAAAAKLCYSKSGAIDLYEGLTEDKIKSFLTMLSSFGHFSPLEHASFTFAIEGVSRALLAQITRHRIASYSVQSQRYVNLKDFNFIIPPEIENDENAKELFLNSMEQDAENYLDIFGSLMEKYLKNGMSPRDAEKKANEDARFVLPNACETKMVVTMNARSLYNFFSVRCCNRAQWEIRNLAIEMLKQVNEIAPELFSKAGPACLFDKCPEGGMGCGKVGEMRIKFSELKKPKV